MALEGASGRVGLPAERRKSLRRLGPAAALASTAARSADDVGLHGGSVRRRRWPPRRLAPPATWAPRRLGPPATLASTAAGSAGGVGSTAARSASAAGLHGDLGPPAARLASTRAGSRRA